MAHNRAFLLDHLARSSSEYIGAVGDVELDLWVRKPAPDSWSVAECAEHVAAVETRVGGLIRRLAEKPQEATDEAALDSMDQLLIGIATPNVRVATPEILHPTGTVASPAEATASFLTARETIMKIADENPAWLEGRFALHPLFGNLDGFQWLLAVSAHTMRHTRQIEEAKRNLAALAATP